MPIENVHSHMQHQVVSYAQTPAPTVYRGGTNSNSAVPNFINKTYTIVDVSNLQNNNNFVCV